MAIQHAMNCKKGFITIGHNDLRYSTANLLTEVYKDVDIQPQLLPVTGEALDNRTANTSRYKIPGDSKRQSYLNKAIPQCYIQNEK